MKYIIAFVLTFFTVNATYALTPEDFTSNIVKIIEEHDKSHTYFVNVKNESLKAHFACQASKDVVYFVKYVYTNQQYVYLVDDHIFDYMYSTLRIYKPYLNKKCKL